MAIRYRYAKAPNGDYVDIKDVNEENRRNMKLVCISCGCDMVASLGDKTHHFRHKQELFCNKETYLHKLGKYTFVKTYKECIELRKPYYITLQRRIPCSLESTCAIKANNEKVSCLSFEKQKWDLTQYYQTIVEEKRVDDDTQKCILFGLAKAYERGITVRNCYLCKHYETNQFRYGLNKDKPIFCRVLYNLDDNGYCKASKARECSGYEPDKTVYEQYLTYAHHYEEVMH